MIFLEERLLQFESDILTQIRSLEEDLRHTEQGQRLQRAQKAAETAQQMKEFRKSTGEKRDGVFRSTAATRLGRLRRVVESTGVAFTPSQKLLFDLRLELITYAVLEAEFPISRESAPETFGRIAQLRKQIALQPPGQPYGVGTPTTDLLKLMERFETDLARVPDALKRFEQLYSKIDEVELGLPAQTFRDPVLEDRLPRILREYPAVQVIPEPYGRAALAADIEAAQAQPG
jgi:hypothetical protein